MPMSPSSPSLATISYGKRFSRSSSSATGATSLRAKSRTVSWMRRWSSERAKSMEPNLVAAGAGLGVGDPPQQREGRPQGLALGRGELALEQLAEPPLAATSGLAQPLAAGRGELDERAAAVIGVGPAGHQAARLEVADGLRHRLRAHPLGGREVARARRALAVEPAEDRQLADGRLAGLGAQTPDEPSERLAELVRHRDRLDRHGRESTPDRQAACTGHLYCASS